MRWAGHTRRALGLAAVTALAVGLGALGPAAPAHAADGTSLWEVQGAAGDYITQGQDYSYAPPATTFTVSNRGSGVQVSAIYNDYEHWWYAIVEPPTGSELAVGTYPVAARSGGDGTAGIDIFGDGRGCNQTSGSFTIHEIQRDPDTTEVTRFSVSFQESCEGFMPSFTGVIAVNATVVPQLASKTTLSAPTSAAPNAPVHLSGSLTGTGGPLTDKTVSVTRNDSSGTTDLGTVVTDAAGAFDVDDTVGTSDATYTASYAGDEQFRPSTSAKTIKVVKPASTLTIVGPAKAVKRGTTHSVHGRLTSQGSAIAGATLTVTRKDLSGTRTKHVTTKSDGSWSLLDVPHVGGTVSWRVSWAGDPTRASAAASTTMAVSRSRTTIALSANHSTVAYKGYVTLSVHLGKTYNGRKVTFAKDVAGDGRSYLTISTKKVSSKGNASVRIRAGANTKYRVRFAGDYRYAAVSDTRKVHVRAGVTLKMSGYTRTSGGYYHYSGDPLMSAHVAPGRPGACAHLTLQVYSGGSWRTSATLSCLALDSASNGYAKYVNSARPVGVRFRVHASVGSTSVSAAGSSPWRYFTYG